MHRNFVLLIFIFFFCIGFLFSFLWLSPKLEKSTSSYTLSSELISGVPSKDALFIQHLFEEYEPDQAYQLFVETYGVRHPAGHALSHLAGESLFRQAGLAGILSCTSEYGWGCYHGFAIAAFLEEGMELISKAEEMCGVGVVSASDSGGCLHGIGHGILAIHGYEYDDLLNSLILCDTLKNSQSKSGCYGGVFMEYNIWTMKHLTENTIEIRPLESSAEYIALCQQVPIKYAQSCYMEQGAWVIMHEPVFAAYGEACAQLLSPQKEYCYQGLGRATPVVSPSYEVLVMKPLCLQIVEAVGMSICLEQVIEIALTHGAQIDIEICGLQLPDFARTCERNLQSGKMEARTVLR